MKKSKKKNTTSNDNMGTRTGQVVAAAVIGAAAGAIAGLLLAPTSGRETLDSVNRKANKLKNDLSDQVREYASMGKEKYNELIGSMDDMTGNSSSSRNGSGSKSNTTQKTSSSSTKA